MKFYQPCKKSGCYRYIHEINTVQIMTKKPYTICEKNALRKGK